MEKNQSASSAGIQNRHSSEGKYDIYPAFKIDDNLISEGFESAG